MPARSRIVTRCLGAALLLSIAASAAAAPPPAEAFAMLPSVSDVGLSPNGNLVAWTDRSTAQTLVVIFDLSTQKIRHRIDIGNDVKLREIGWADDETVLVEISKTSKDWPGSDAYRYELFRTLSVDVNSGKTHLMLMAGGSRGLVTGASLLAWRTAKPKTVLMSTLDYASTVHREEVGTRLAGGRGDSGWVLNLYEVDTRTGKGIAIETGDQYTDDWVLDGDGHCVARSEWDPKTASYRVLAKRGGGWTEVYARNDGTQLDLYGVTDDGKSIVGVGPNGKGRRILYALALDGTGARTLFEDADYDVAVVERDRFTRAAVGVWLGGPRQDYHWFDEKARARAQSVQRAFKGLNAQVYGRSQDGKRLLARVDGPSNPAIYYLVDFTKHTADIVGEEYPALADAALGEMRAIDYKARDGTSIPAYLTLPPGATAKNLPMVVLPHGGPEWRDEFAFGWWPQFLASRGYAVLQPQFRGSIGYGEAFRLAGHRQWGLLMQDDVSDGVQAMIDQGIANAGRICIVGASYGGYAALAGAAFTPKLYKCAASISGVSDLPDILAFDKEHSGEESNAIQYWLDDIGSPFDKNVIERSPARAAQNIQAPILLIHGQDDTVVPIAQSETMARSLAQYQKVFTFVKLTGEDHWMSRSETRLHIMQELEKFLATNL